MIPLFTFEWTGTFLALFGAFLMASNKTKPHYSYYLWIISNFLFIYFFLQTSNYGLLMMNTTGVLINLFGLHQWKQKEHLINGKITSYLLKIAIIIYVCAIYYLISFFNSFSIKDLEWFGSCLGMASAFLLSSRHKYSFLCWFFWTISNSILMFVGYQNSQYGFLALQTGFMISNFYGAYTWFNEFKEKNTLIPVETPSQG